MAPVLEARGITRSFGHIEALKGVDFDIDAGEVVALIGDNGAGKSTLVKIMSGADRPTSGHLLSNGAPLELDGPVQARSIGIETVYQDLALAPHLSAVDNMFLGREIMRPGILGALGMMQRGAMQEKSRTEFAELGATVSDLHSAVVNMSGGQRQSIAVARAAAWAQQVIFLDEPTAALGVVQTQNVLELIRRVRDRGVAVVLISHSMPHVLAVADRVQVLRQGRRVATYDAKRTTMEELVGAMTGAISQETP